MTQQVFLHVGLPKSGTTFLQAVLGDHKQVLRDEAGLLFPGRTWTDQVLATRDVRGMPGSEDASGAWRDLVEEIHGWGGDAVVSMEWLCAASPRDVGRIVDDLAPSHVTAVFTVRDLGRALPSAWQEMVKNTHSWTWPEFLTAVTADDPLQTNVGRRFWSKVDLPRMLDTWSGALPRDDLVVITVPPASAPTDLLWRRLAEVMGVDPRDRARAAARHNRSLGVESTELLRRVNERYASSDLSRLDYDTSFKLLLAPQVLAPRAGHEARLRIPPRLHAWVHATAEAQVEGIRSRGVRVVGDLTELSPAIARDGVDDPADVAVDGVLEAALDALLGLARAHARLAQQVADLTAAPTHPAGRRRSGLERLRRARPAATGRLLRARARARLPGRVRGA